MFLPIKGANLPDLIMTMLVDLYKTMKRNLPIYLFNYNKHLRPNLIDPRILRVKTTLII